LNYVNSLIDYECNQVDSKSIILGGFGQGAALALLAGLTYRKPLSGICAIGGFTVSKSISEKQSFEINKKISVLCLHGKQDRIVSPTFLVLLEYHRFYDLERKIRTNVIFRMKSFQVPLSYAQSCYEKLRNEGVHNLELYEEDGTGHEITPTQKLSISYFFQNISGGFNDHTFN